MSAATLEHEPGQAEPEEHEPAPEATPPARALVRCAACPFREPEWCPGLLAPDACALVLRPAAAPFEYPNAAQMAGNLARAAGEFVASGFAVVEPEELDRRLAICHECTLYDAAAGRCTHPACGCFMAIKARAAAFRCPIGKW